MFSSLLLASVVSAGIVHIPLGEQPVSSSPHLSKRAIHHGEQIMGGTYYVANLEVGTPPQNVSVAFDTGSGHLWLPGKNSTACEAGKCVEDVFDISKSTSWRYKGQEPNWGGNGVYGDDTVSYAGGTVDNFKVWVSKDKLVTNLGIFGQARDTDPDPSTNFCQGLAASGQISRALYSLNSEAPITIFNNKNPQDKWKRTVNNVYYGGYDRAKYEGPLTAINVTRLGGYTMPFSGFKIDGETHDDGTKYNIILDTGGVTLSVPNKTMKAIVEKHGGEWSLKHDRWTVACDAKPVLTYKFGYTEIDVDMDQFIKKSVGGPECLFQNLRFSADNDLSLLSGPSLISKAMVIYDNDRGQILIAKAKYTDESDVVEITGDIEGAVQYTDYLDEQKKTTMVAKATGV